MTAIQDYDSLLLDLDGTVWEGGRAIPGAVENIIGSGLPTMYVTNNASKAPQLVADQLEAIGLPVTAEQVLTSAQAAVEMLSQRVAPGSKVLVVGSDSFKELAYNAGFHVVNSADDNPAAVLHGHNPDTGWAQLSEAALAIRKGALYLASNLDTTLPQERGLMVGNGSMVAAVVSATGVTPESAGKPGPAMFHSAAAKLGSQSPLAVGDRLDTDIAGGNAAGMDTLQVLTGVSGYWDLLQAPVEYRPTLIASSLEDLNSPAWLLKPNLQGDFTATVIGDTLTLSGGRSSSTPIESLRTALYVAWQMPQVVTQVTAGSADAARVLEQWW